MRRSMLAVCLLIPFAANAAAMRGAWHLWQSDRGWEIELTSDHNHNSHSTSLDNFRGLTDAQINSSSETAVRFQIVHDAGTFDCSGTFLDRDGVGRFTFTPDASYADRLRSLGVAPGELTDDRLYRLANLDISTEFIREMQSLGYRESLDRYCAFRIHGVTPQYVRDLRDAAVTGLESDRLVALRIHGASIPYIHDLASLGYRNLSSDQLVQMRIHGVTPQYIRDLQSAGYEGIPVEKLVQMRIHGINADFVRKAK